MADNALPKKTLRGIGDTTFCVHPSGNSAFFFDDSEQSFVQYDFDTGQQKIYKTQLPKKFDEGLFHFSELQSSNLFIYSIFSDNESDKTFVVSLIVSNDIISIVDKLKIDDESLGYHSFQKIERGQYFYVSYFRKNFNTKYNATQIQFDEQGKITSTILSRKRLLNDEWCCPFFHIGTLYWLPWNNDMIFEKILRVSLHSEKTDEIRTRNNITDWPNYPKAFEESDALVISHHAYFYATIEKNKFGMLLRLDMQEMCWRRVSNETGTHILTENVELKNIENDLLYMHGSCSAANCRDRAHIYIVDVRNDLKRITENTVQMKILSGIQNTAFCIHPYASAAFFFDRSKPSFEQIDLTTGQQKLMEIDMPKEFDVSNCASDHTVVLRSSKLFILSAFYENSTNKYFIVSFSVKNGKIFIIDQRDIGIDGAKMPFFNFHQDANGQVLLLSYFWLASNTIFDAALIYCDDGGKIGTKIIVSKRSLNGHWCSPFLNNDTCYWLSWHNGTRLTEILKISFDNEMTEGIRARSDIADWPNFPVTYSLLQMIGDDVFCYAYEEKNKFSIMVKLDMKEKCWQRVPVEMIDHIATSNSKVSNVAFQSSVNGLLCLHGNCCVESCKDKAHIFIFDVRKELKILASAAMEAKNLAALRHSNIIIGYGFKIEGGHFLLFMEKMKESVRQKILRTAVRRLEENEAFHIVQQALEGANILLDEKGTAKLGDFGLVKPVNLNTADTTDSALALNDIVGTRYWQAPEVLDHGAVYGRKADIWSIGCSLVEMLTGNPPYCELDPTIWIVGIVKETLTYKAAELVPGASKDALNILDKCFRRFTKAKNVARDKSDALIRPHSWELLADIININKLLLAEQEKRTS